MSCLNYFEHSELSYRPFLQALGFGLREPVPGNRLESNLNHSTQSRQGQPVCSKCQNVRIKAP